MANEISEICLRLNIPWVFGPYYDKDRRSSLNSFHGVGVDDGLSILVHKKRL